METRTEDRLIENNALVVVRWLVLDENTMLLVKRFYNATSK